MSKRNIGLVIAVVVIAIVVIIAVLVSRQTPSKKLSSNTKTTSQSQQANAINNAIIQTKVKPGIGEYLTDPQNNTLYTYSADTFNISNCSGSCLASWPAYLDKGSSVNLPAGIATIKRTDNGELQFTYKGRPLYFFVGDSPGQVTGNNVAGFSVARP